MTVTDNAPATTATAAPPPDPAVPVAGFAGLLGSGDHKTIGRLWILTSFLFLLGAGVTGAAVGAERMDVTSLDVLDVDTINQTFALHSIAGVFLFALPLLIGIATYIVPLQVGSSTIAFPRAAAAAYWTYLVSGGIIVASFLGNGGPFGGEADLVDLYIAGIVVLLAALTLAMICVATTVVALRTPGMNLRRTPLFSWANLVAAGVWIVTLPVLAGLMILAYIDHRYGRVYLGGNNGLYVRVAWAFAQPTVYAFAIPALGIIGDIVPVAAKTRLTMHKAAMAAIGGFGVFAVGSWAMPGFSANGQSAPFEFETEPTFVAFSFLIVLPTLAFLGLVADTLRRGKPKVDGGLVFSVAALLLLLVGAVDGAVISISRLDLLTTTAQTAHTHTVLIAVLLAAFGGLTYWSPKLWGTSMPSGPTAGLAVGGLLGAVVLAIPDFVSGFLDQIRGGGVPSDDLDTIEALNTVALLGGLIVVVVAVAFIGLVAKTIAAESDADDDPVEGHTLEWATTSPPPVGNFVTVPAITSEAPLYDARYAPEGDA